MNFIRVIRGSGSWLLECAGSVQPLPAPAQPRGIWELLYAEGSQIPLISDGKTKKWCMEIFQEKAKQETPSTGAGPPPELDLEKVSGSSSTSVAKAAPVPVPTAALAGLTPPPPKKGCLAVL